MKTRETILALAFVLTFAIGLAPACAEPVANRETVKALSSTVPQVRLAQGSPPFGMTALFPEIELVS